MPCRCLTGYWLPASVVSLEFLLEALAKQRKPEESPQQWRMRVEKRLQEPPGALLRSFGGETLNMVCQVTVNIVRGDYDITAKVQVQKGAPVQFLLGSDLLPRLGFSFLESQTDDTAVDHFHHDQWKKQPLPTPPQQELPVSDKVGTVRPLTATRLPPRHTKIVRAHVEGVDRQSISLLTPEAKWESKGLQMEEALLEPDGELCVSVPIQNPTCEPLCISSGDILGQIQPVAIVPEPKVVATLLEGDTSSHTEQPIDPNSRDSCLLENSHFEESLTGEEIQQLKDLIIEFSDVFAVDSSELGTTDRVTHVIDTGDSSPIKQHPRRIPFALRAKVDQLVKEMLEQGVVSPSKSPWSSPVVLVTKKDGSTRFCVDYRQLNSVTKTDVFPLPRVDDSLDQLANSCFFTTLDLASGYWQVLVDANSREKTAFVTHSGLYEFSVMPFGLKNTPATFQRLMETVLAGLIRNVCLDYLDDIIVTGKTFSEHLDNLRKVLTRLREAGLRLKP